MRKYGGMVVAGTVLAALTLAPVAASAAAPACTAAGTSDFNGDGVNDVAVGDIGAIVDDQPDAGSVQIRYGGGDGRVGEGARVVIHRGSVEIPGERAEPMDHFSIAMATGRVDADGCTDLVVGADGVQVNGSYSGAVYVIYGSPAGLGRGKPTLRIDRTTSPALGTLTSQAAFGQAVALRPATAGQGALLAVGAPRDDIGAASDAGRVAVVALNAAGAVSGARMLAASGSAEPGANFGEALVWGQLAGRSDRSDLAVGAPSASVAGKRGAGTVTVFSDVTASPGPVAATVYTEDRLKLDPSATFEQFGKSLAFSATPAGGYLAVGVPNAKVGAVPAAGAVYVLTFRGATLAHTSMVHQDLPDVLDTAEPGDAFGLSVALSDSSVTGDGVLLAVGIPSESVGVDNAIGFAGAVHLFDADEPAVDRFYTQDSAGVPTEAEANEYFGVGVGFASSRTESVLLAGAPAEKGPSGNRAGLIEVLPVRGTTPRAWTPTETARVRPLGYGHTVAPTNGG